jgi:hypothetical protein
MAPTQPQVIPISLPGANERSASPGDEERLANVDCRVEDGNEPSAVEAHTRVLTAYCDLRCRPEIRRQVRRRDLRMSSDNAA